MKMATLTQSVVFSLLIMSTALSAERAAVWALSS